MSKFLDALKRSDDNAHARLNAAADERLDEALERIRIQVDQPSPGVADWDRLIGWLQAKFCKHEWETQLAGGDPAEASSTERVTSCKHCGLEL